jgi:HSP20 family protein
MTNQTPNGAEKSQGTQVMPRQQQGEPVHSLRNAVNRLFDDFTMGWNMPALFERTNPQYMPRVNVAETEKDVVITAELPGMELKDIEVKLLADKILVKGEKREEKEEKTVGYHHIERTYGSFERVLPVPSNIKKESIEAVYKDGVLRVTMPKTEEAVKATKTIEVKGK